MPETVYHRLARHLDDLPGGFPPSPSGVEIRILERLFRPDLPVLHLAGGSVRDSLLGRTVRDYFTVVKPRLAARPLVTGHERTTPTPT